MADPHLEEKRAAGRAAAALVSDGMRVGVGAGSTVACFIEALARRDPAVRCVAASPATARLAREAGLGVEPFSRLDRLDLAVDGADGVAPDLWLLKGGGGAHTREKVVAAAADRWVVIVSPDKLVQRLAPPVAIELLAFGLPSTLRRLGELGEVRRRPAPPTPDGNLLADLHAPLGDPAALGALLDALPGVVGHGLFPPELVSEVLVGRSDGRVDRLSGPP